MARDHVRMKRPVVPKKATVTLAETTWMRIENYRKWRSLEDDVDYSADDVFEGFAASLDRNKEFVAYEKKALDELRAERVAAAAKAAGSTVKVAAEPEATEPEPQTPKGTTRKVRSGAPSEAEGELAQA